MEQPVVQSMLDQKLRGRVRSLLDKHMGVWQGLPAGGTHAPAARTRAAEGSSLLEVGLEAKLQASGAAASVQRANLRGDGDGFSSELALMLL